MKGFKKLENYDNVYLHEQSDTLYRVHNGQMFAFKKMEIIQEQMPLDEFHKEQEQFIFDAVNSEHFNLLKFSVACLHKLDFTRDEVVKIILEKYQIFNWQHQYHLSKQVLAMGASSFYKAMDRMHRERIQGN